MHLPTYRITHTKVLCYTCRGALAGTRNSTMGPPWRIDSTNHRTMCEQAPLLSKSCITQEEESNVLWPHGNIHIAICFCIGARCSSVVRAFAHGAMCRRVDPPWWTHWAILVPASAPRLVYQRPWYVLSCLWDGAYKRTLAVNRKE